MSIPSTSELATAGPPRGTGTGTINGEGSSNGADMDALMFLNNVSNPGKRKNIPTKRHSKAAKAEAPRENNNTAKARDPQEANGSAGTPTANGHQEANVFKAQAPEPQHANGSKAAKPPKVNAKATTAAKPPEKTFSEKLGSDLADRLQRDPKLLGNSLNLVDRVSFVKLPQAAAVEVVEEEEDDSPDSSLISEYQAAGVTVQKPSKEKKERPKEYEPRGQDRETFDLNDFTALASLEDLICRYGRVSHMGILDKSYTFFITKDRKAALYYKVC